MPQLFLIYGNCSINLFIEIIEKTSYIVSGIELKLNSMWFLKKTKNRNTI